MARKDSSKLNELIAEYGIKDMNDVCKFVKMLTAETIQVALYAESDNELDYSKYDYINKQAIAATRKKASDQHFVHRGQSNFSLFSRPINTGYSKDNAGNVRY